MQNKTRHFSAFDPRLGEDWTIQLSRREAFSSRERGFFVVDSAPWLSPVGLEEIPWLIHQTIEDTGDLGFVACSLTPPSLLVTPSRFTHVEHFHKISLAYFSPSRQTIDHILNAKVEALGHEKWILGSCDEAFAIGKQRWYKPDLPEDLAFMLRRSQQLGSLFAEEEGWVTILVKRASASDHVITALEEFAARYAR